MLISVLILLLGLALIIKGAGWFVSASVRIAELLKMSRVVIGSTLVSLTTTSPELVVSIMAGLRKESGLALGNAMGSCICNMGLILGLTAAFKHIDVHPRAMRTPLIAMFGAGALLLFMTLDLRISPAQGIVLVAAGLAYFAYDFIHHKTRAQPADVAEATQIEEELVVKYSWLHTKWGTAAQFLLGAAVVVIGSKLLVESAVEIATALGISTLVIGLTVVAVGTSLPELVTAITSARQNVSDLAIGNVLGANVANLTLIVGTAASIHEVTMDRVTQLFNFPSMLLLMGALLYILLSERRVTRREGVFLLASYAVYLTALILLTVFHRG
jgi:cation:H+ antiporter